MKKFVKFLIPFVLSSLLSLNYLDAGCSYTIGGITFVYCTPERTVCPCGAISEICGPDGFYCNVFTQATCSQLCDEQ